MYVDMNSPDYLREDIVIFLDGVEQHHCVMFDTNNGVIECFDLDENGKPKLSEYERVPTIFKRGFVTIEYRQRPKAPKMVTVVRIVKYEGTEQAVRKAIAMSLPLGVKVCSGYSISVGEHINELPPLLPVTDEDVAKALEDLKIENDV